jgi:hypothetical protein
MKWYSIMILPFMGLLTTAVSCEVERECFICPRKLPCLLDEFAGDTLFITGFELGQNPTEYGGSLGYWNDTLSGIGVTVQYDTAGGGASGSRYYARLDIAGNDGDSPKGWSGGGLVLNLSDCMAGIDISGYDSLQFEVRTFPGSNLGQTKVKLEDVRNDSIPERYLIEFNDDFPSGEWITVSVPLSWFGLIKPTDPLHQWVALDEKLVLRLVTITINDPHSGQVMDGALGVDEVRVVKN